MYRSRSGARPFSEIPGFKGSAPNALAGPAEFNLSRRRFVQGLAGGALVLAGGRQLGWGAAAGTTPGGESAGRVSAGIARGAGDSTVAGGERGSILRGTEFELSIGTRPVNFTGASRTATLVNGQLPAPLLYWRQGDTVTLRVTNRLPTPTSIHWHGMILPANMDGVPGISFPGIPPGETFVYRFPVTQSGTYWYHSHSRFQEQIGLYGPIIIEPRGGERHHADREHVVLLSDWTDTNPEHIYRMLKVQSDYFNYGKRTVADFFADVRRQGFSQAVSDRRMWGQMRMNDTDLLDVSGHAYTYLMNGVTPAANWTGLFRRGERVRLRVINGSSMSFFDIRIPGLPLTVVAADGQDVEPVTVDEFRIGPAEVYDVIVEPKDDRAYTIFAQSMDRSGYARGTLAPAAGMEAEIPPLDPRPVLTMSDMGMGGMGHRHGGGSVSHDMAGMRHGADGQSPHDMAGMRHGADGQSPHDMAGMGRGADGQSPHDMAGMRHGADGQSPHDMAGMGRGADGQSPHDMAGMTHGGSGQPSPGNADADAGMDMDHTNMGATPADSSSPKFGPNVDSVALQPTTNLADPGIGLRNNGRRVLTYADLRTIGGPIDSREPGREIRLHLTGHMQRFVWSFDGKKFSESRPLQFNYGERLRIVLVNDSMMTHPIHLHGMWSEVESPEGEFLVRKHTIVVQPGQELSYGVTANALGRWAFHCHLLYHMEAGMFREVVVEQVPAGGKQS
jgi:CopA family copper-resistance protein